MPPYENIIFITQIDYLHCYTAETTLYFHFFFCISFLLLKTKTRDIDRRVLRYLSDSNLHECLETAWNIVNDSYRTDICLLYPPYLIALSAIYLASFLKEKDLKQWFSDLSVEMAEVQRIQNRFVCTNVIETNTDW